MIDQPQPKCPRCGGTELTLFGKKNCPAEPGLKPMYVYKCACGTSFTSDDKLPDAEPEKDEG
jgi:DNA-directed RNA polymerase subunit RPC12/RpoP